MVRTVLMLVICLLATAPLSAGCGGAPPDASRVAPEANPDCAPRLEDPALEAVLTKTHAEAVARGSQTAEDTARRWVAQRTADGYRLRGWVSTLIMVLGLFMVGLLVGGAIHALLKRPGALPWAERLERAIDGELRALRELAGAAPAPRSEEQAAVASLGDVLRAPLEQAERAAERLVDLCAPLERNAPEASDGPRARYAELESLLAAVERLHAEAKARPHDVSEGVARLTAALESLS